MGFSTTHLIIFLVIIVLVFGTKKLKNIGSDLGGAVKGFKDGMKTGDAPAEKAADVPAPTLVTAEKTDAQATIDVQAKVKG